MIFFKYYSYDPSISYAATPAAPAPPGGGCLMCIHSVVASAVYVCDEIGAGERHRVSDSWCRVHCDCAAYSSW